MASNTTTNIHEAAMAFANDMLYDINAAAAEMIGVDVLWFRATPDKKNQDVIFQTYTLYGVNDCPLEFKAVYTDMGYDDAALTYNIMGIEYAIPLTLEIAIKTWYEATGHDGTMPQRGDIVFIPQTKKLVEVVSMTPVKALGGQLTSFKMNCAAYKPKRSVLVGENLRATIEENTVSQDSVFGQEIKDSVADIVDKKQTDIFNGTSQDSNKEITKSAQSDSIFRKVGCVHSGNIEVDGHLVARSYYDLDIPEKTVVRYKNSADTIKYGDERCLSAWVNVSAPASIKNIKEIEVGEIGTDTVTLILKGSLAMNVGDEIVIERGSVILQGKIISASPYKATIRKDVYDKLTAMSSRWYKVPGFTAIVSKPISLIDSDAMSINLVDNKMIQVSLGGVTYEAALAESLVYGRWYGFIVNIGTTISIDAYTDSVLKHIISLSGIKVKKFNDLTISEYRLNAARALLTNIRLYKAANNDEDKKIEDIISYMIPNDSLAIVNDSADIYIDDPYTGKQR